MSHDETTEVYIASSALYNGNPEVTIALKRRDFEHAIIDVIERMMSFTRTVLHEADIKIEQVDKVFMCGGSSQIPRLRESVSTMFLDTNVIMWNDTFAPEDTVAMGLGVKAGVMGTGGQDEDIAGFPTTAPARTPLSIGVEASGGVMTTIVPMLTPVGNIPTRGNCTVQNGWEGRFISRRPMPFWVKRDIDNDGDGDGDGGDDSKVLVKFYVGERVLAQDNLFVASLELNHRRQCVDDNDDFKRQQINVTTVSIENMFSQTESSKVIFKAVDVGNDSNVATMVLTAKQVFPNKNTTEKMQRAAFEEFFQHDHRTLSRLDSNEFQILDHVMFNTNDYHEEVHDELSL